MRKAIELLHAAKSKGIDIVLHNDQLQLKVPAHQVVDQALVEEIRTHKQVLLDYLGNEDLKSRKIDQETNTIVPLKKQERDRAPLSFAQERLLFIDQLQGTLPYHLPWAFRLAGKPAIGILETALKRIVERHEVLRTVFRNHDGFNHLHTLSPDGWRLGYFDINDINVHGASVEGFISQLIVQPFNLSEDYMLRVNLIRLAEDDYVLVAVAHHIAFDGWSISILISELTALYESMVQQQLTDLPPLALQYADFSAWQNGQSQEQAFTEGLQYWKEKLAGTAPLQLFTDHARKGAASGKGGRAHSSLSQEMKDRLIALSIQEEATLFMTLLTAFNVLLYRYTGQQDICVGTPVAGRNHPDIEALIGFFVNTLAIRNDVPGEVSFRQLLRQVKASVLDAYQYQDIPFEKIVEGLGLLRDSNRNPVFQVMFGMQQEGEQQFSRLADMALTPIAPSTVAAKFDCTFNITETARGLDLDVVFSADLFDQSSIERLLLHYQQLLKAILEDGHTSIDQLPMLSPEEAHTILYLFNATQVAYPDTTVVHMFEEQVRHAPDAIALYDGVHALTYQAMDERANQLAHHLRHKGLRPEMPVVICLDGSMEMVWGIMAILKAGGVYVPLNPAYPPARIQYVLDDVQTSFILTTTAYEPLFRDAAAHCIYLDAPVEPWATCDASSLSTGLLPQQLAYIIYTSGSTGAPKGVMIGHQGLVNYLLNSQSRYLAGSTSPQGSYMHLPFTFDASITALFIPLISGRTLVTGRDQESQGLDNPAFTANAPYDFIKLTPAHLQWLEDIMPEEAILTNRLVIGGEALLWKHFDWMVKKKLPVELVNEYGPTEATVGCSIYTFNTATVSEVPETGVLIGKPLDNIQLYIVDKHQALTPIGVPGELCIGGVQVAKGYWNQPTLTAEKFIDNPFDTASPWKLYKTGDIARWLPDGNIQFIGRRDDQVKINGFRIETGEIEHVLQQAPGVKQCAIAVREDTGDKYIAAYLVATPDMDESRVWAFLREQLPSYMLPAMLTTVSNIPLTPNGKVDKQRLIQTGKPLEMAEPVQPRNDTEQRLQQIWQQVLKTDTIGIQQNFFLSGGHSLLATRMQSLIKKEFNIEINIKAVFDHPTIAALAQHISSLQPTEQVAELTVAIRPEQIPLSYAQERLWFIDQLQGSVQYQMPWVFRIGTDLQVQVLEQALQAILQRHEVLRTVIQEQDGVGYQVIRQADEWALNHVQQNSLDKNVRDAIADWISQPFDLSRDYMLRAWLLHLDNGEYILVVVAHHIAFDGWSVAILTNELQALYEAFLHNKQATLPPLAIQYADYAIWQRQHLNSDSLAQGIQYWKHQLAALEVLDLPLDYPRPARQGTRGGIVRTKLPDELAQQLTHIGQQQEVTLFMLLLAVYKVLLYRYSAQHDICVGCPVAGRTHTEVEPLIGFFVNTLAIRSAIEPQQSFDEFLQQLKTTTLQAYEHQQVPFEKIVEALAITRDMSRSPVFQVMFSLRQQSGVRSSLDATALQADENNTVAQAKFDLSLEAISSEEGIELALIYSSDLYSHASARKLLDHYLRLLQAITENADHSLAALSMLSQPEEVQLMQQSQGPQVAFAGIHSLVQGFDLQAARTPQQPVLFWEDQSLTYHELRGQADALAQWLLHNHIQPEDRIGLFTEPGPWMITAMLAVLKAGAAYVPIDIDYPADRISWVLQDAAISTILTTANLRAQLPQAENLQVVELDTQWDTIINHPGQEELPDIQPNQLAYVIYTSGSTGRPKGVMIEHQSILNRLRWGQWNFNLDHSDVVLQKTTYCFDISVWEIFWPLLNGCKLVLAKRFGGADTAYLKDLIQQHQLSVVHFVPSLLEVFLHDLEPGECASIRHLLCSGEALKPAQVNLFCRKLPTASIHNLYGPTEAAIEVTCWSHAAVQDAVEIVPIGKPIANTQLYVLNESGKLCPPGVPGELHIGGIQLARGYLGRPDLTRKAFIANPLDQPGRLYKTGDRCKWNAQQEIEFLGRNDEQLKLHGYRIEPGEIEAVLKEVQGVEQAMVLVVNARLADAKRLAAFVAGRQLPEKDIILQQAASRLPAYMVPADIILLKQLPVTRNGKVNKQELKELIENQLRHQHREYIAPRNQMEEQLATIWQQLLNTPQISIHDNFFELGGHSLLAIRLVSAIRREMGAEINIRDIFIHPTIAGLATSGALLQMSIVSLARLAGKEERIPASFAQERLWFIDQLHGSVQYNMRYVFRLKGPLDSSCLESSFREIMRRHEALRTGLKEDEKGVHQLIRPMEAWSMDYTLASDIPGGRDGLHQHILELSTAPFDLSEDWMLRVSVIQESAEEHILVAVVHHIAFDGWSIAVMVSELSELYRSHIEARDAVLPVLPVQYADYAIWQRSGLTAGLMALQVDYWKTKLKDLEPLQLPTDYPRPALQSTKGAVVRRILDKTLNDQLTRLSQEEGVTLFMTLLSAFKVLLYRYTGQYDIYVGTPVAGRQQQELEGLIGFFVNTLVLRSSVNGADSFHSLLRQVKQTAVDAYVHQAVPFEKIVEVLGAGREMSRHPITDINFQLQNMPDAGGLDLGGLQLISENPEEIKSIFDLGVYITKTGDSLRLSIEYCSDLYKRDTIERMALHYENLLRGAVENMHSPVHSLPMLSKEEEQQLINGMNRSFVPYPVNKTVIDLFEEQVLTDPDAIALVFEQQVISYRELSSGINQVAAYLTAQDIHPEKTVAVCVNNHPHAVMAILGVLKAGGVLVPIEETYPDERIAYILQDTGCTVCLADETMIGRSAAYNASTIFTAIDTLFATDKDPAGLQPIESAAGPEQLAYINYVSGRAGKPNGVMIEHRSLADHLFGLIRSAELATCASYAFFHPLASDAGFAMLFVALTRGSTLHLLDHQRMVSPAQVLNYFSTHAIDCLKTSPAYWLSVSDNGTAPLPGKVLIFSGEPLLPSITELLRNADYKGKVYNHYGTAEATIGTCIFNIDITQSFSSIPIGVPFSNTQLYILDRWLKPCPVGVAGELYIGGDGLARGYLHLPAVTAEKFINDPYRSASNSRLYKTGDIARWLADGNIEYLGRKDEQVKIKGHRIEPGEVEGVLNEQEAVVAACVVPRQAETGTELVAYYVPNRQLIKEREVAMYEEQVNAWQELYENENLSAPANEQATDEFSIAGWNDSFTGLPIPHEQMQEWLSDIVQVILSTQPQKVLEIGCGSGLIFYQLAGKVNKYIGTDFSGSSIRSIQSNIRDKAHVYGETDWQVCAAHAVRLDQTEEIDTVVINSVIQYFPGEAYLSQVLDQSIGLLKGRGRIIVGDVRDIRLLRSFKTRLHLAKTKQTAGIRYFDWYIQQELLKEEELCIDPEYFYQLQERYPQISFIDIRWKQGDAVNELSLYRYNVIIYVGYDTPISHPDWISWNEFEGKDNITEWLKEPSAMLALKDLPNPRLWKERVLHRLLSGQAAGTVRDLDLALAAPSSTDQQEAATIEQLTKAAVEAGYECRWLLHEEALQMNLLIVPRLLDVFVQPVNNRSGSSIALTNIPLIGDILSSLKKELHASLMERLPAYMVPVEYIGLLQFPLNAHGKTDRKFLQSREEVQAVRSLDYQAPVSIIEQQLAAIWQELLQINKIGLHDNFFELGGHSLLATRIVSAIRKKIRVEVSVRDLFVHATIFSLAAFIAGSKPGELLPAITLGSREGHIPLSFAQERIWFIDRLQGSVQYHLHWVFRLNGKVDINALEGAFRETVDRHEVLRTVIREENGKAFQYIKPAGAWKLTSEAQPAIQDAVQVQKEFIDRITNTPFDLAEDDMLRVCLLPVNPDLYVLVIVLHHIASDGWSLNILIEEVKELYNSRMQKRPSALQELPVQYADFSLWQRTYLSDHYLQLKLDYWKKQLAGSRALELPGDFIRPALQTIQGGRVHSTLSKDEMNGLLALSWENGASLFMTLLAAFKVLLYKYTGHTDICLGSPIAGRQQQEVETLIGLFVNTLALRCQLDPNGNFLQLLQQVRQVTLDAYEHQDIPFEKVVEALDIPRDLSRTPVFQIMFALHNTPGEGTIDLGLADLVPEVSQDTTAKFDLNVDITATADGLYITIVYNTALYTNDTIERLSLHYKQLLYVLLQNPGVAVGKLSVHTAAEEDQIAFGFNSTDKLYPSVTSIAHWFEAQAHTTPDAVALVFEEQRFTYREINERAGKLGHYLREQGIREDSLVPICLQRSPEMIIGILGILKAGAAYVPVDPEYPLERIAFLLQDTAAEIVLCNRASADRLSTDAGYAILELDTDWPAIAALPAMTVSPELQPNHLAYVIYTSGSTGKPKGVMIEHRAIVNRLQWAQDHFMLTDRDVVLQKTTFCFDVSVWELLWPLLTGARLVLARPGGQKDNQYLEEIINREQVTMLHFVPPMLDAFLSGLEAGACASLTHVLCSGEALKLSHVHAFREKLSHASLHNLYGPTEAAVDVTCWSLPVIPEDLNKVVIGQPVANTRLFILDADGALAPIGVAGDLYIGGVQLARGYLNQPALTAERFVRGMLKGEPGERLYKTGDLARWLPDGHIEFLGRIDDQVKIRGYRIEPAEIEQALLAAPGVHRAIVLCAEETSHNKRLVGFVVAEETTTEDQLLQFLHHTLPDYMVPSLIVRIQEVPLTINGKSDRKQLLSLLPGLLPTQVEAQAPQTLTERTLAAIWQELLGKDTIDIHDNFFTLGGDSIISIQLVSRAKKLGYELHPRDLFMHQSIASLAALLQERQLVEDAHAEQGILTGPSGLLPIQQWFFEKEWTAVSHFNQAVLLGMSKEVTIDALSMALGKLMAHHDSLRFVYTPGEHGWQQAYSAMESLLIVEDLRHIAPEELPASVEACAARYQQSLNIQEGILLRVVYLQMPASEPNNRLLVIIHHLAVDGVSWRILLEDMEMLLSAAITGRPAELGKKTSSYRQWQEALTQYSRSKRLQSQTQYWEKAVAVTFLLPVDHPSKEPALYRHRAMVTDKLNKENTRLLLQETASVYHTEVNDLLLAALAKVLNEWTGQHRVVIGLEGHGREDLVAGIDISRTIGWFTSLYPLALEIAYPQSNDTLIKSIKEQIRQVPDRGIGYGVLKYINRHFVTARQEPWPLLFNYLGQSDNMIGRQSYFTAAPESAGEVQQGNDPMIAPLSLTCLVTEGELVINWVYNQQQYTRTTISCLSGLFLEYLTQLILHCIEHKNKGTIHTPFDFGLAGEVSVEELDQFISGNGKDLDNIMRF